MSTTEIVANREATPEVSPATSIIKGVQITGGFLDGMRIQLAEGLNCIIGARGTGKTTVLEMIRYALDQVPEGANDRKRFLSLMKENLDGGEVKVDIVTRDGLEYRISRVWNEPPIVRTFDDQPTQVTLQGGGLFRADIFSQNQIERIAEDARWQLGLLDTFEAERIGQIETQLRQTELSLAATTNRIGPLSTQVATLREEVATLPNVEEKLKQFTKEDPDDSGEVGAAHTAKSMRDRERRTADSIARIFSEASHGLGGLLGAMNEKIKTLATDDMLAGPNGEVLRALLENAWHCGSTIDEHLSAARERIAAAQEEHSRHGASLATVHGQQELQFRKIVEQHQTALGQVAQRSELERLRNSLLEKKRQLDDIQRQLAEAESERTEMLEQLRHLRGQRFGVREAVAARINTALEPAIRVTIRNQGDTSSLERLLARWLSTSRLKHKVVATQIAARVSPSILSRAVRTADAELLANQGELNLSQAGRIVEALNNPTFLHELETLDIADVSKIELFDRGEYRESFSLSTGQKCTSILPILLLKNESPLLVDQPEDNLDNRFVCETIVENIAKARQARQLIFVTHNPNIPVLGDAEQVFVLQSNDNGGHLAQAGSVEECKCLIVDLLEGGREAFDRRGQRYGDGE